MEKKTDMLGGVHDRSKLLRHCLNKTNAVLIRHFTILTYVIIIININHKVLSLPWYSLISTLALPIGTSIMLFLAGRIPPPNIFPNKHPLVKTERGETESLFPNKHKNHKCERVPPPNIPNSGKGPGAY